MASVPDGCDRVTTAFVSYTQRDSCITPTELVHVADRVSQAGYDAFVDLMHNRSRFPQSHICAVLESASILFLCQSPSVLISPWVRWELRLAKEMCIPIVE